MLNQSKQYLLLIFTLFVLVSCSKGKLEYREPSSECIAFPEPYQRTYSDTSTTMETDRVIDKKLDSLLRRKDEVRKQVKQVYLINTSYSNTYSFTIKVVPVNENTDSKTTVYKLQPGEELLLGCDAYVNAQMDLVKQKFKIVGEKKVK